MISLREQLAEAVAGTLRAAVAASQELRDSFEDAGKGPFDVMHARWLLEVMATKAEQDHGERLGLFA